MFELFVVADADSAQSLSSSCSCTSDGKSRRVFEGETEVLNVCDPGPATQQGVNVISLLSFIFLRRPLIFLQPVRGRFEAATFDFNGGGNGLLSATRWSESILLGESLFLSLFLSCSCFLLPHRATMGGLLCLLMAGRAAAPSLFFDAFRVFVLPSTGSFTASPVGSSFVDER